MVKRGLGDKLRVRGGGGKGGRGSDLKHETSLTIYRYLIDPLGTICIK